MAATLAPFGGIASQTRLYAGETLPDPRAIDALVIMGGPMGVHDGEAWPWLADEKRCIESCLRADLPVLGICLGAQLMADVLGAPVRRNRQREIGWFPVERSAEAGATPIGARFPERFMAMHWHGDAFDAPSGAVTIGSSAVTACQGFVYGRRGLALQFHIEMTREGAAALIEQCGHELAEGGPAVQDAAAILQAPWFEETNRLLDPVVAAWLAP